MATLIASQTRSVFKRFENRLAGQNLSGHGGGMGHAGAADRLHQRFLDDAVLDVQRELAGSLLGSAPAHAVGQTGNVGHFLDLRPSAFLRNRRRAVIRPLGDHAHLFNFVGMHRELRSFVRLGSEQAFTGCQMAAEGSSGRLSFFAMECPRLRYAVSHSLLGQPRKMASSTQDGPDFPAGRPAAMTPCNKKTFDGLLRI